MVVLERTNITKRETVMEDGSQSTKSTNKNGARRLNKNQITALVVAVVVAAAAWGIYSWGMSNGKEKAKQEAKVAEQRRNATNPLLALPASGQVTKISDKSITVKLLGNETTTAAIDKSTQITNKSGKAKVSDIKTGAKTIVFTKRGGNGLIATKIILQ